MSYLILLREQRDVQVYRRQPPQQDRSEPIIIFDASTRVRLINKTSNITADIYHILIPSLGQRTR